MVSQVTLGNFYTNSNGKLVEGGAGGSGLDTKTLIDALTTAKQAPATKDQDTITANGKITAALTQLNTLLSNFQQAADALRNPPGVNNAADNAFLFTKSSVTSNTAVAGSTYLSVATAPGATIQNYTINSIDTIASSASQSSTVFTLANVSTDSVVSATPRAQQFGAGTITIRGQDIQLNAGDTLGSVVAKFNAVSSDTGISATMIKISPTTYQLSFSATDTGTANNFDLTNASVATVTDPSGVLTNIGFGAAASGTNAEFHINGVDVVRSSNNIDDVITGVTFSLLQQTPVATTLNVAVQPDTTTVQNTIVAFTTNYNALQTFIATQTQQNSDGTYAATALLANNTTFRQIVSQVTTAVTAQVAGLAGSGISSLSDIGITLVDQPANAANNTPAVHNIMNVDDGKLTNALTTNYKAVQAMMGFTLTSNNPNLAVFSENNAISVNSFTLTIDPGTSTFDATYNDGSGPVTVHMTATPISGSTGYTLSGPSGSALQGLKLIYASASAATINVGITQGIASQVYNTAAIATTLNTGTLAIEQTSLQGQNTRLQNDITTVNLQVAQYRDMLTAKFAALEQAIAKVNTILQSLQAQADAQLTSARG